jgi:predicted MFS family arabinose efflux permease
MRTFRSLRHRNYRLYFAGQLVSLVGSWTQITTLMWLAHEYTGESKWPAFLSAVQIGPTFLLGAWGGTLADRLSKRGLIIRTQAVFLTCALALLGLYLFDLLSVWTMLAVMFVHGIVQAIDLPARLAFVPGLVARSDLSNAVALNSLLFNVARAIGPAIAALLLGAGKDGPLWCFLLNAASYLAVIVAIAGIRLPPVPAATVPRNPLGGFHVLAKSPGLLALVFLAGLVAAGGWPLLALLPSLAQRELGRAEGGYGTLLSCVGVGALLAALTAATIGGELRPKALLLGGLILVGVALVGIWATTAIPVAAGCCVLFGFGMILFFATGQSVVQLGTVDANRGKVMGIWAMMLSAGVPLGNLVLGPAADVLGVKTVIAIQAAAITIAAGVLMTRRIE